MATALKLRSDIKKLKKAIETKGISDSVKSKLKVQLEKAENELSAMQKTGKAPKKSSVAGTKKTLTALEKLLQKKKFGIYKGKGVDIKKDAERPALPIGKRKSKSGNTYYEYRANRIDVRQPSKKFRIKLEDGGDVKKQEWVAVYVNQEKPSERKIIQAFGDTKEEATRNARMSESYHGIKKPFELIEIYTYSGNLPMMAKGGKAPSKSDKEKLANLAYQLQAADEGWIKNNHSQFVKMLNEYKEQWKKVYGNSNYANPDDFADGGMMARGGTTKKSYTYIPNRDVEELMVVLNSKSVSLKGSDILDGVYAKNSALSKLKAKKASKSAAASNLSADEAYNKLVEKAKNKGYDDLTSLRKSDVKKLINAGCDMRDLEVIYFGVVALNPKIDISYGSGMLNYGVESLDRYVTRLVDAIKNKKFEIGLKYPQFSWTKINNKYKISKQPKLIDGRVIEFKSLKTKENYVYAIYEGDKLVLGTTVDRVVYKDGVKQPSDPYYKVEPITDGNFKGGYWGMVTSSKEVMYDVANMILSQTSGYVKDMELFKNGLGGVSYGDLDINKIEYADGGMMEKGGEIKNGDYVLVDNPYWKASMGTDKPVRRKVKMVAGDSVFFSDGSNSSIKYVKKLEDGGMMSHGGKLSKEEFLEKSIVYDNGGESFDRYTIYTPDGSVYGMSETGSGFNQYLGEADEIPQGKHLGKKLKSVPKEIESAILSRMEFADGGMMARGGITRTKGGAIKLYYHQTSGGAEYLMSSKVQGTKGEGSSNSKYIVRIDGAEKYGGELIIREAFEDGGMMAKGGIYSSEELYIVKVFDGKSGELLDVTKRVWAKNISQAQRMAMEDFEYEMKAKYGDHLRFKVEEAPSMMARGGYNTGRSWHLDRARHNQAESWERPLNQRKKEDGGIISTIHRNSN